MANGQSGSQGGGRLSRDPSEFVPQPQNIALRMGANKHASAPPSARNLGDMMAPSAPAPQAQAAPQQDAPDFEAKVKRNESFLQSPEIQNALLDFAINIMAPGMTTEERQDQQKIDLANRQFGTETSLAERKLGLDTRELDLKEAALKVKPAKKYSKLVSGESPMGMELGLTKGQRARVEFEEDAQGNIINASVQDNPSGGESDKPSQIVKLTNEMRAAEAAGDRKLASQLKMAIQKEATGQSFQGALDPGTELVPDENGQNVIRTIPGSKKAGEEAAAATATQGRRTQDLRDSLSLTKAIDRSLGMIQSSAMPNFTITGLGSYLEYLRGSGANDLARNLDTVKATLGFAKLQDIRDASKTGGALGPVSDFENRLMQATVASLENSQKAVQLVENLKYVKAMFDDAALSGKLSQIGRKLDPTDPSYDPNFNEAMAVAEASQYLDTVVSGVNAAQLDADKDINSNPPPIEAPPNASDEIKNVWHGMTPAKQQRVLEILRDKEKKNAR